MIIKYLSRREIFLTNDGGGAFAKGADIEW